MSSKFGPSRHTIRYVLILVAASMVATGCNNSRSNESEPVPSEPETFIFEQGLDGYTGFDDTTIFSESEFSGGATRGIYSGTILNLAFDGSRQHRRALMRADLSSIPTNWIVEEVSLRLTVRASGGNFGDIDYHLHRLNGSWGEGEVVGLSEGGFGAPAMDGDATWLSQRHNQSLWATPGGDFVPLPSATAPAGRMDVSTTWSSPELVDDVQAWVATPSSNDGWIIIGELEGTRQRVKRFYSSESDSNRPHLIIVARAPDQPALNKAEILITTIRFTRTLVKHIRSRLDTLFGS